MTQTETVDYRVRRGDTLQKIVKNAGFPQRDWVKIYNAPYNRRFKRLRPDPDVIHPGDVLKLPKYNARDLVRIVQIIADTAARLDQFGRQVTGLNARIDRITGAMDRNRADVEELVSDFDRQATRLREQANDVALEACEDWASCAGAGAHAANLTTDARALERNAARLRADLAADDKRFKKRLKEVRDRLRRIQRAQSAALSLLQRALRTLRSASRNPY